MKAKSKAILWMTGGVFLLSLCMLPFFVGESRTTLNVSGDELLRILAFPQLGKFDSGNYDIKGETIYFLGLIHERRQPDFLKELMAARKQKQGE